MLKFSEGGVALSALIIFAMWLLVALPLLHSPAKSSAFWDWLSKDAAGFFAFLAVGVAALQAWFFWYQLRLMRKSLNDASTAAQAALNSAEAAARQASVAEQSFAKLERPYVYIFGAKGLECDCRRADPYDELTYHVANFGKTPASILSCHVGISVGKSPKHPCPVTVWHSLVGKPILVPNEMREIKEVVPYEIKTTQYADEDTAPDSFTVPVLEDGESFFVLVRVLYRGPFSGNYETSACWRWDRKHARLVIDGDELNYMK